MSRHGAVRPYPVRRMRGQLGSVVAITGTVLVLCALAAAVVFGVAVLSGSALRTGLVSASAGPSTVQVSALYDGTGGRPGDPRIERVLTHALAPVGSRIIRTAASSTYDLPRSIGAKRSEKAVFWSVHGAGRRLRLVDGTWPRDARGTAGRVPVAVPAVVADHFGLHVGSRFSTTSRLDGDTVPVTVTGTWAVRTGSGTATGDGWTTRPLLAQGHTGDEDFVTWGPLLVAADRFEQVGSSGQVDWLAVPDWSATTPAVLDELRQRLSRLGDRIGNAAAHREHPETVNLENPVPGLLAAQAHGLVVFRSLLLVPVALLAALAVCGLLLTATLLAAAREREEDLLRSRGASPLQLVRPSAAEAGVVGLVGAGLGPLLAAAVLTAAGRSYWPGAGPWVASGLTGLVCAVVLTIPSGVRSLRQGLQRLPATGGVSRRALTLRLTGLLVVTVLGAVAAFQLLRYGVSTGTRAAFGIDPLLVAAPAVVLVAATVLAELAVVPLVRVVSRFGTRRRDLPVLLGAHSVARDLGKSLPLALLVALAAGSTAFAVEQIASVHTARQARAAFVAGGDVRVDPPPVMQRRGPYAEWRALSGIAGVSAAVPVYRSDGVTERLKTQTVAVDVAHLDGTALTADAGGVAPDTLAELRQRPWHAGPSVPAGGKALTVAVRSDGGRISQTTPLLADGEGMPYAVTAGNAGKRPAPGGGSGEPAHLVAAHVTVETSPAGCGLGSSPRPATVRLDGVSVGRRALDVGTPRWWLPRESRFQTGREVRLERCTPQPVHHLVLVFGGAGMRSLPAVPAVVTDNVAGQLGVGVGDMFQQRAFGVPLTILVVGIRPYLPTLDQGEGGILVDAGALVPRLVLAGYDSAPQQWWVVLADGAAMPAVADRVARLPGVADAVTTRDDVRDRLAGSSAAGGTGVALALWVTAAAGVAVTALVLVATTLLRRRERRLQSGILRTLGARRPDVLSALGWEYLLTAVAGAVGGFVTGTFVLWVMLGPLTLGSSGQPLVPPASLVVPALPVAALLAVLVAVPAAVVVLVTHLDLRSDLATEMREEGAT